MKKQVYTIKIAASRKKVWEVLWNNDTYVQWSAVFSEGSRAESNWEEGDKIFFLGKDDDGIVSKIARKIPYEYMSFQHLGEVHKGKEVIGKEESEWCGAHENYSLEPVNGETLLKVDMDITEDYVDYFDKTWPLAMEKIKELSEAD
ncbi:SRPBCC domain-containing protein [Galbibacter sp. PAP.153]|uniref:SRPBCC domain-containing protein n=1 Tax=Galbibacter sp. PAP.153 TaxID=3104623 RepID=UPI00300A7268